MIPGVDRAFIDGLRSWVESAATDGEREAREKGALSLLFDGADTAEAKRIEALMAETGPPAKEAPKEPVVEDEQNPSHRRKWTQVKFYDVQRKQFSRSTREEGIGDEQKKIRDEARGTPLFGGAVEAAKTPAEDRERLNDLRALLQGKKKAKD